ncbi:alpha/beta hydrolase family protein [Peristeroidobacter agariperforans]|uniref:alpha/beta hydrolase family protein n=1 Tax=Peristeroidobacter agariperforans TaxID=268404 RepID=UPI00101DF6CE|nr:prolyl oligopeptidase family serine peptidase [Peristeroidobacter agariperforans]
MSAAFSSVGLKVFAVLGSVFMLAACSNNDDDDSPDTGQSEQPPPPPPTAGTLIENPPPRIGSFPIPDLINLVNVNSTAGRVLDFIVDPECGVDVHQIRYNTVDPAQQPTTASGALMIPTGTNAACQGPRPIIVYAHGTQAEKAFNIANLSNTDNAEGLLIAVAFAAQGYIVVAPNYAGYDTSTLAYHPYLHADQQAKDTSDALAAARSALPTSTAPSVTDSGRLFITGYSQGGFVAMATHRLLQTNGVAVTAAAPMSGPYALSAFGDAVFQGQVIQSAPALVGWVMTAYQRIYGGIYAAPTDAFEARYASGIETLFPTTSTRSQIYDQGLLPREQLFSSTPPDPAYAQYTPATSPADLAPVFARGFGPENLITNSYRAAYLQDSLAHPDGGFPTLTDGLPAAAPAHPLRVAFKANDLRNWSPTSPVLLCAGHDDPTVQYMNTDLMQRYWTAAGVTAAIRVLDVDDDPSLDDDDAAIKLGFNTAKESVAAAAIAGGATDGGAQAVADAYHSSLVPPFCLAAVQSFFDGF